MPTYAHGQWKTTRGEEWWWSGDPAVAGDLDRPTSTFSIETLVPCGPEELWGMLRSTAEQFPDLAIQCRYDDRVKAMLDRLQSHRRLKWVGAGHPRSQYARVEMAKPPEDDAEPQAAGP